MIGTQVQFIYCRKLSRLVTTSSSKVIWVNALNGTTSGQLNARCPVLSWNSDSKKGAFYSSITHVRVGWFSSKREESLRYSSCKAIGLQHSLSKVHFLLDTNSWLMHVFTHLLAVKALLDTMEHKPHFSPCCLCGLCFLCANLRPWANSCEGSNTSSWPCVRLHGLIGFCSFTLFLVCLHTEKILQN